MTCQKWLKSLLEWLVFDLCSDGLNGFMMAEFMVSSESRSSNIMQHPGHIEQLWVTIFHCCGFKGPRTQNNELTDGKQELQQQTRASPICLIVVSSQRTFFPQGYTPHMSQQKHPIPYQYPNWLIGFPTMSYYNPQQAR